MQTLNKSQSGILPSIFSSLIRAVTTVGLLLTVVIGQAQIEVPTRKSNMWTDGAIGFTYGNMFSYFYSDRYGDFKRLNDTYNFDQDFEMETSSSNQEDGFCYVNSPIINSFGINKQIGVSGSRTVGNIGLSFNHTVQSSGSQYMLLYSNAPNDYSSEHQTLVFKETVDQIGLSYSQDLLILKPKYRFNILLNAGFLAAIGLNSSVVVSGSKGETRSSLLQTYSNSYNINERGTGTPTNYYGINGGAGVQIRITSNVFVKAMGTLNSIRFVKPDTRWAKSVNTVGFNVGVNYTPFN